MQQCDSDGDEVSINMGCVELWPHFQPEEPPCEECLKNPPDDGECWHYVREDMKKDVYDQEVSHNSRIIDFLQLWVFIF